jgi:hypothetical protein
LPTQMISPEQENKSVVTCPNCGRILYWIDWRLISRREHRDFLFFCFYALTLIRIYAPTIKWTQITFDFQDSFLVFKPNSTKT